jgi:ADP-dependent phosphofructokinase/glucokinase
VSWQKVTLLRLKNTGTSFSFLQPWQLPKLSVPISNEGIESLENFKLYCVGRKLCTLEEFEYGSLYGPDHDAVIIPSKVVDKPKATVGIGDAISAGAFAAMLARMKQKKAINLR